MNGADGKWQLIGESNSNTDNVSQVQKFYAGKSILLTGCTDFLGMALVEKLLRSCTEIDKIYLLIRPKKDATSEERLKKYTEDTIFDKLRETKPNFMKKLIPINGNLLKDRLGLSHEDRRRLVQNVDVIIHNGAVTYFNVKVSSLLRTNVLGTQQMLDFAAECSNLKAFVYVSTAYSHCHDEWIKEKFYPSPGDLKMVKDMIQADEENSTGINETVVEQMIGKSLDLYAFSKSIAESLVEDFARTASYSCAVFRPTIVAASYNEPSPGWTSCQNGPTSFLVGAGLGLVRAAPIKEGRVMDFTPVDMTVNNLLTLIWDLSTHRKSEGPQVYNYGSSDWNPIVTRVAINQYYEIIKDKPFSNMIWYPSSILIDNFCVFFVLHLLLHCIPAALYDLVRVINGKQMQGLSVAMRIATFSKFLDRFTNGNWIVEVNKSKDVLTRMNAADLKIFPFDMSKVDKFKYIESYVIGIRTLVLKDPLETVPAAKEKYRKLKMLHYVSSTLLSIFVFYLLYRIVCYVFCC